MELRLNNLKNINTKNKLHNIINRVKLTDEEITDILISNGENNIIFSNKLIKTINKYKDDPTTTLARIVKKHCERESINNVKKRREIKRKNTLNTLETENIGAEIENEKRIILILDNYSVHKSAFIKKVAKILNIVLIFLPPYSPHLNPIEQLWRMIKNEIKHHYLKSEEYLEELTKKTFKNTIKNNNISTKWYNSFIPKV